MRLTEGQIAFLEKRWLESREEIARKLRERMNVPLVIVGPNEPHDIFTEVLEANFTN